MCYGSCLVLLETSESGSKGVSDTFACSIDTILLWVASPCLDMRASASSSIILLWYVCSFGGDGTGVRALEEIEYDEGS